MDPGVKFVDSPNRLLVRGLKFNFLSKTKVLSLQFSKLILKGLILKVLSSPFRVRGVKA